jgi:hypothetical protein
MLLHPASHVTNLALACPIDLRGSFLGGRQCGSAACEKCRGRTCLGVHSMHGVVMVARERLCDIFLEPRIALCAGSSLRFSRSMPTGDVCNLDAIE